MYADYTVIYMSAKTPCCAAEILTNEMKGVSEWLKNNHLTLNLDQDCICVFPIRRKTKDKLTIKIDKREIQEVVNLKLLGVVLDSQLKFDKHVEKICKTVKVHFNCFRMIRHYKPLKAAHVFMP